MASELARINRMLKAGTCSTCFNSTFVASPRQLALHRLWRRVQDVWGSIKHIVKVIVLWSIHQLIILVLAAPVVFMVCLWLGVTMGMRLPVAGSSGGDGSSAPRFYEIFVRVPINAMRQGGAKGKGGV